jgi:hypothetical protein
MDYDTDIDITESIKTLGVSEELLEREKEYRCHFSSFTVDVKTKSFNSNLKKLLKRQKLLSKKENKL